MKKFALIFSLCLFVLLSAACSVKNNSKSSKTVETNIESEQTEVKSDLTVSTVGERTQNVICYIHNNYLEYNFDRFVNYGVSTLVENANESELEKISENLSILEKAIEQGENLSQGDFVAATGSVKAIFDIERPLFRIWYRLSK